MFEVFISPLAFHHLPVSRHQSLAGFAIVVIWSVLFSAVDLSLLPPKFWPTYGPLKMTKFLAPLLPAGKIEIR